MKVGNSMRIVPKYKFWKIIGITAALGLVLAGCGNGKSKESARAGNNDYDA